MEALAVLYKLDMDYPIESTKHARMFYFLNLRATQFRTNGNLYSYFINNNTNFWWNLLITANKLISLSCVITLIVASYQFTSDKIIGFLKTDIFLSFEHLGDVRDSRKCSSTILNKFLSKKNQNNTHFLLTQMQLKKATFLTEKLVPLISTHNQKK